MALARKPFVVIDAEILSSSVWSEAAHVKLVWLTLLILCDTEGYVGAAIPGIARAAGVSLDQAREALSLFMLPDPDSRTQRDEGRRLEPADRGFRILNFREHLDRLSVERTKARDRVRRFRERKRQMADGNVTVPAGNREQGIGNREQKVSTEALAPPAGAVMPILPSMPANPLLRGRREALELELQRLVAREAELTDRDPIEVMAEVTTYDGAKRSKLNAASMSDDRLANSVLDARARIKRIEEKHGRAQGRPVIQQRS
jgi:hypothetical protein